jgi:hypothetical protein
VKRSKRNRKGTSTKSSLSPASQVPDDLLSAHGVYYGYPDTVEEQEILKRLNSDERSLRVAARMSGWGIEDRDIEYMFREISIMRSTWEQQNKNGSTLLKRRLSIGSALKDIAKKLEDDPEHFGIMYIRVAKDFVQKSVPEALCLVAERVTERSEWSSPLPRKSLFRTWAARKLCDLIEENRRLAVSARKDHKSNVDADTATVRTHRTPNEETATLLNVAYGLKMTSHVVTQARKGVRRRYHR